MEKIKSEQHIYLTERVLKFLSQNKIITILDFLQEDTETLSTLTTLSLPQILTLRNDILRKYSAPLVNGRTLLTSYMSKRQYLSSGIDKLDEALEGGIPLGYLTEVCGLANSGKTQLCFQLAVNASKNGDSVLYIDTKGDFSALRIQRMLGFDRCSHKEMARIMFNIRVAQVWTMEELVDLLKSLKEKVMNIDKLSLIIIDSLPCLMFQHLGDNNKIGLTFLNTFVNYSRFVCKEYNIGIICVNIQTRWVDQEYTEFQDDPEQLTSESRENAIVEKRNRCLGNYWKHIPSVVMHIDKIDNNTNPENIFSELNVAVTKFNNVKCSKQCIITLSDYGVT